MSNSTRVYSLQVMRDTGYRYVCGSDAASLSMLVAMAERAIDRGASAARINMEFTYGQAFTILTLNRE